MRVEVSSSFNLSTGSSRVIRLSRNLYRLPTCNDLAFGPANWCKGYLQCKLEVHTKHNDTTHELLLITRGEFHRDSLFLQRRTLFYTNTGLLLTITSNKSKQSPRHLLALLFWPQFWGNCGPLSLSLERIWKLGVLCTWRTLDVVLW